MAEHRESIVPMLNSRGRVSGCTRAMKLACEPECGWILADGGGEHGQEHRTRAPRSRGRGRGQEGKGNKVNGDTATPEAASETTSNKADDGKIFMLRICMTSKSAFSPFCGFMNVPHP